MSSDQFYNELIPEVISALTNYGTEFQVRSKGVYNSETMQTGTGSIKTVLGLISDGSIVSNMGNNTGLDASRMNWVGKRVLLLSPSLKADKTDEVNVDGVWHSLTKINELKPANVVLLYILDLTK